MFGFDNLQFKDSFSFLSSSLDRLVGLNKYKDYKKTIENKRDVYKHIISKNNANMGNKEVLLLQLEKNTS